MASIASTARFSPNMTKEGIENSICFVVIASVGADDHIGPHTGVAISKKMLFLNTFFFL